MVEVGRRQVAPERRPPAADVDGPREGLRRARWIQPPIGPNAAAPASPPPPVMLRRVGRPAARRPVAPDHDVAVALLGRRAVARSSPRSRRRSRPRRGCARPGDRASTGRPGWRSSSDRARRRSAARRRSPRPARQPPVLGEEQVHLALPVVRLVGGGERPRAVRALARRPARRGSREIAAAIAGRVRRVDEEPAPVSRTIAGHARAGRSRRPGRRPPSPRTACSAS